MGPILTPHPQQWGVMMVSIRSRSAQKIDPNQYNASPNDWISGQARATQHLKKWVSIDTFRDPSDDKSSGGAGCGPNTFLMEMKVMGEAAVY